MDDFITRIRQGTIQDRFALASEERLPPEAFRLLLEFDEDAVLACVAMNEAAPRDVLAEIVRRGGDSKALAVLNPNAPAEIKDLSRIGEQTDYSLLLYARERGATDSQLESLRRIAANSPHPTGPLLGAAWEEVVRPARTDPS